MDSDMGALKRSKEFIDKYSPPILDCDHTDWIASYEMGHLGYEEDMYPVEKTVEGLSVVLKGTMKEVEFDVKRRHEYILRLPWGKPIIKMQLKFLVMKSCSRGLNSRLIPKMFHVHLTR